LSSSIGWDTFRYNHVFPGASLLLLAHDHVM